MSKFKRIGRNLLGTMAGIALASPLLGHAGPISGFETGLAGWDHIGDASTQTAAIGLTPTEGSSMAIISTIAEAANSFSGTGSPQSPAARAFLGVGSNYDFLSSMPLAPGAVWDPLDNTYTANGMQYGMVGESGAIKMRFYVAEAGTLSFDWNRLGKDGDTAYFSVWSDDPASSYRHNDWVYDPHVYTDGFSASGVDLCSRDPVCLSNPNPLDFWSVATGWHTKSMQIEQAGWYWIGFGLGEIAESTVVTALALDNLRFEASVPEPESLALVLVAGALGMAARRRR